MSLLIMKSKTHKSKSKTKTIHTQNTYSESNNTLVLREKGRDLTRSYDKCPTSHRKNPKSNVTTQKRNQNFDCTTIADRLRTVSYGNDNHPTGVVKPVNKIQPSHSPQQLCNRGHGYAGIILQ